MSCLQAEGLFALAASTDCLASQQLARLLESLGADPRARQDRRHGQRFPFPRLIPITPMESDGRLLEDDTFVVVGKSVSSEGIGFFHQQPYPYRRSVVMLPISPEEWLGVVTDVRWCRFTRYGWYESGGRFLDVVEVPLAG